MFTGGAVLIDGKSHDSFGTAFSARPETSAVFLFPLIGLAMMYHCLALWINKTEVKLENGSLILTRGPLPWIPGKVIIPTVDIKQAYVQEYSPYAQNKKRVIRYCLIVQTFSAGDLVLETGISHYKDAHMLEEWLEKDLGIQDVSVPGEYDKKAA